MSAYFNGAEFKSETQHLLGKEQVNYSILKGDRYEPETIVVIFLRSSSPVLILAVEKRVIVVDFVKEVLKRRNYWRREFKKRKNPELSFKAKKSSKLNNYLIMGQAKVGICLSQNF